MTTAYSPLLGLALPVTGELAGQWGSTVNDYITTYLDSAVAGTQTISGSQTAVTLSVTNGSSLSQAGSGATGSSQYSIINCTGNPAGLLTITVPAASKIYLILNATSTSQSVKIVGTGPTTGVTVVSGEKALVAWNGSDFVKIATAGGTATFTNVTVTGTTTLSGLTASTALALDASKNVVSVTNTGSGNNVLSASPTLTGTVAGASLQLSSLTSGRVTYAGTSGLLQDSANLTFDGTTLVSSRGASNGVAAQFGRSSGQSLYVYADTNSVYLGSDNGANTAWQLNETSDYIAGWLGGSEQMRLTSTGLGIGTSSPTYKVDLGWTDTSIGWYLSSSYSASIGLSSAARSLTLATKAADATDFIAFKTGTASTERMRIDTSGNVGIGTTSPNSPAGATQTTLHISNATASTSPGIHLTNGDTGTTAGDGTLIFVGNAASTGTTSFNIYNQESSPIVFFTATAEKMRLDASGNLGLGVTPSAWSSSFRAMQVNGGFGLMASSSVAYLFGNGYYNTSNNNIYYSSAPAVRLDLGDGFKFFTAASGTAGNTITFTQAMTLDASGRLGVGTTSMSYPIEVVGAGVNFAGSAYVNSAFLQDKTNYRGTWFGYDTSSSSGLVGGGLSGAGGLQFYTNSGSGPTERARITSGGYSKFSNDGNYTSSTGSYHEFYQTGASAVCYFRATNASYAGTVIEGTGDRATTNASYYLIDVYNGNISGRFRVTDAGNCQNTNSSYGGTSDIKLKQDIVDAASQWDDIKSLRVRKYRFKDKPKEALQIGVIAQELEQISPGLVDESIDRDKDGNDLGTTTKSVKYSVLYMKAVKALQEAMARIEKLEADVAALKGN